MPFVPLVAMGALVFCLVNFLRNAVNHYWSPVVTQLCSWASGVVVVMLFAQTDWASTIVFGDKTLAEMNWASQLVLGLMASSMFGVVSEIKKAVDTQDTAKVPPLLPEGNKK